MADPQVLAALNSIISNPASGGNVPPPPPVQPKPFWGSDGGVGNQQNTINQAKDNSTLSDIAKDTAKIQAKQNADYQANDQNNNHDEKMQSLQNLHDSITASTAPPGDAQTNGSVPKIDSKYHLKDLIAAIPLAVAGGLAGGPAGALLGGLYGGGASHVLGMKVQKQDILNQLAQQTANTAGVTANSQKALTQSQTGLNNQERQQNNKVFNSPLNQNILKGNNGVNSPVNPGVGGLRIKPRTSNVKTAPIISNIQLPSNITAKAKPI